MFYIFYDFFVYNISFIPYLLFEDIYKSIMSIEHAMVLPFLSHIIILTSKEL